MGHNRVYSMFKAVIWDFGGVITSSPFDAFNTYEQSQGLPHNIIRQINATNPDRNAWAQFERNEITAAEFNVLFSAEADALGHAIPGDDVLACLAGHIRPQMVAVLEGLKRRDYRIGCITNNVQAGEGAGMARTADKAQAVAAAMALFDLVIESSKVGVRKPDPAIYQMACEGLGIAPSEAIFLDDLGINLKPARAMGMTTIKVGDPDVAISQLSEHLGHALP